MANQPQDEELADHPTPLRPDACGSRTAGHQSSRDGILLAELADLDESLQERGAAWKELARRLDGLRRQIAVTSAQVQRSRSLAARRASRDGDDNKEARPAAPIQDEARAAGLTREFEAALRETEERRVALHAEMEDLRRRRQALHRRLPAPISRAYQALADWGRMPAVAAVVNGACGGCQAPLAESVIETLSQGAVVACARCELLLRPSGGGK